MKRFEEIKNKIIVLKDVETIVSQYRKLNKKIVFTNGCFDIIHRGHLEYLAKASDFGDCLIIGLNSDKSVKLLKGETRPLQDEYTRALILSGFGFVGNVVIFDDDTPYELIKLIKPDFLVKGADYKIEDIVGYDIVTQNGGSIVTIELVEGHSSTRIIKKLQE